MIRPVSLALAAALALAAGAAGAGDDTVRGEATNCAVPSALTALGPALDRVAARIKRGEALTIVALGSSSTRGVGASAPQLNYPSRLEAELRERLPDIPVRVINRGINGEEVPQMLARLDRDIVAEHPDLVIWQLGTNAVLHHDDVAAEREPIERGIARIERAGSDVVLMDLQYAPRVLARPAHAAMEAVIADAAAQAHVGLFHRFAIMQQWQAANPNNPPQMIGRDGVHMTDRGYGCLAADLADALVANSASRTHMAQGRNAPTLARLNKAPDPSPEPFTGP